MSSREDNLPAGWRWRAEAVGGLWGAGEVDGWTLYDLDEAVASIWPIADGFGWKMVGRCNWCGFEDHKTRARNVATKYALVGRGWEWRQGLWERWAEGVFIVADIGNGVQRFGLDPRVES